MIGAHSLQQQCKRVLINSAVVVRLAIDFVPNSEVYHVFNIWALTKRLIHLGPFEKLVALLQLPVPPRA